MDQLVTRLSVDFPALAFHEGTHHCWSPSDNTIMYEHDDNPASLIGVLHEVAHALLHHNDYSSDLELLRKELAAWDKAKALAGHYRVSINDDHVQNCLDTYRDWLHRRSKCPTCKSTGIQYTETTYGCINCDGRWRVTASRFCRPYRRVSRSIKT